MTDAVVTQEAVLVLHRSANPVTRVTQEAVLVLHRSANPETRITQEAILVLHDAPIQNELIYQILNDTNLYNEFGDITESTLKWCILDNQDLSEVVSILDQNSTGSLVDGLGTFVTIATPGNYTVGVQGVNNKIKAYLMSVV